MKGYVGESCPECGNFTMVRNGDGVQLRGTVNILRWQ